jgi:hypothetical protein
VEIFFTVVASTDITESRFGQVMEESFNQGGPFHHKSCDNNNDADSPRETQSAWFSFEET